jgi:hypothetical protein
MVYTGFYNRGVNEMFTQMGDVFEEDFFQAECDMVDQHQMLVYLPHVTDMRHDFQPELSCQQTHGQEFTDAADACAVNLDKGCRTGLHEIFELNAIGNMLAQGHLKGIDRQRQRLMPQNIIGSKPWSMARCALALIVSSL